MNDSVKIYNTEIVLFDETDHVIVSNETYKANQEKLKRHDPSAHKIIFIDKERIIFDGPKAIGYRRLNTNDIYLFPGEVLPENYSYTPRQKPKYPTSISDEEPTVEKVVAPAEEKNEEAKVDSLFVDDPDVFVNMVNNKRPRTQIPKLEISLFPFDGPSKDDDDLFIKVTQEANKAKRQRQTDVLVDDIIQEFKSGQPIENSQDVIDSIISEAKSGLYDATEPEIESDFFLKKPQKRFVQRTRKQRFISPENAIAIILAAGISLSAITFAKNAVVNSTWYENMQSSMQMSSMINTLKENDKLWNFISPNKIVIPGSFDSYGSPMWWLDTDGVAKAIINEGDELFPAALYYAYYDMSDILTVGNNNNWDHVISSLSYYTPEENLNTTQMISGCTSFESFLIKNGFVNEDGTPSKEKFEEYGKKALETYVNSLNENQDFGGRK